MKWQGRKVRLGTAVAVAAAILGAGVLYAWVFLRGKVEVKHTVGIDEGGVTVAPVEP